MFSCITGRGSVNSFAWFLPVYLQSACPGKWFGACFFLSLSDASTWATRPTRSGVERFRKARRTKVPPRGIPRDHSPCFKRAALFRRFSSTILGHLTTHGHAEHGLHASS